MTIISQILYQQITSKLPPQSQHTNACKAMPVPADYQLKITTDKEYNNIISNTDVLESATTDKSLTRKTFR